MQCSSPSRCEAALNKEDSLLRRLSVHSHLLAALTERCCQLHRELQLRQVERAISQESLRKRQGHEQLLHKSSVKTLSRGLHPGLGRKHILGQKWVSGLLCTFSLGQHHGMPHQSHGSGEIAWSKKGFAQPHTFQHRKCDHILEEWITMCLFSCPSIPPPDTTSHLTAMPLLGLGYIDSLPPPSNSVVHPHSLPTSAAYACLTDVP